MTFSNFSFLESEFPILFNIGQSAEFHLFQDAVTCIFKIRQFGERVKVKGINQLPEKIESQYQSLKSKIDQLPQTVLAKAFRGELVGQEVREYVRELEELGMVAEGVGIYNKLN
ncbi:hypothetical protein ACFPIK_14170 [Algoriphagus aquatilis]|uniref:Type I restriction enzyme S subunit n=1 Tax=Algoriphagus aquatilis TaxID=490186 RepID=A0ABW0C157_9BACT